MSNSTLNSQTAVQDYFSSLLLDTQKMDDADSGSTPVLRFALVKPGFELAALWRSPMTPAQQRCQDFMILAMLQQCSGPRLRVALLNSIQTLNSNQI